MITPEPFSSIMGRSARSSRTAGNRFSMSARCHSRSSRTANPPAGADDPPTTWTMISMPPSRARTASATAAHPSADVISAATKASISARSPGAVRAVVSTFAPISHSRAATAWPIPLLPPVTSARLPSNSRAVGMSHLFERNARSTGGRFALDSLHGKNAQTSKILTRR